MKKQLLIATLLLAFLGVGAQDSLQSQWIGINSDRPGVSLNPQNPGYKNFYIVSGITYGKYKIDPLSYEESSATFGARYGLYKYMEIGVNLTFADLQKLTSETERISKESNSFQVNTRFRLMNNSKRVLSIFGDYTYANESQYRLGLLYTENVASFFVITSNVVFDQNYGDSDFYGTLNFQFPVNRHWGLFVEGIATTNALDKMDTGVWYQFNNSLMLDLAYTYTFTDVFAQQVLIDFGLTYSFANQP